ncbi:MAG: 3-hydroxybutyrate oligomer hydrolase family protein, partial [Pseudomonadota bacterium]
MVFEATPKRRESADDLLTAGLGLEGVRRPSPPEGAGRRQIAFHKEFRELLDVTDAGGFARIYKPNADALRQPGTEHLALLQLPGQRFPFAALALIPDTFNWEAPCLVAAPASGSRGATGAIGDIGAWALTEGCALVLTDKSCGVGANLLGEDISFGPDLAPQSDSAAPTLFRLPHTSALRKYLKRRPHAVAMKHAHSEENPEADWPETLLAAIRFGLYALNASAGGPRGAAALEDVAVIAAGVSNGGGTAVRAAEADREGLIDGVVAAEPNVRPGDLRGARIMEGDRPIPNAGRSLFSCAADMNLLAPCAALSSAAQAAPLGDLLGVDAPRLSEWSARLARAGLIDGDTDDSRAEDALRRMTALGFGEATRPLLAAMHVMRIWPAVTATYASAYGAFPIDEAPADIWFAFSDGPGAPPRAATSEEVGTFAARSGGIPPSAGLEIFYGDAPAETAGDPFGDAAFAAALVFKSLSDGDSRDARRIADGLNACAADPKRLGAPTILLHGRSDSLLSVNHTSRAYYAAAETERRAPTPLRYYEVERGQHFETLLMLPGFPQSSAPLTPHTFEALS